MRMWVPHPPATAAAPCEDVLVPQLELKENAIATIDCYSYVMLGPTCVLLICLRKQHEGANLKALIGVKSMHYYRARACAARGKVIWR